MPAFLGQALPPLLSANAGTARCAAGLHRNLSTPLQGGQHFHISPTLMDTQQAGGGMRRAMPCGCCSSFTTLPAPMPCTLALWDAGSREGGDSRAGRSLHHKHRGQIPSGSTDSPFSAGLPCRSAPSPSQQLQLSPQTQTISISCSNISNK